MIELIVMWVLLSVGTDKADRHKAEYFFTKRECQLESLRRPNTYCKKVEVEKDDN